VRGPGRTIVYVVDEYPTVSETFVFREIDALRKMGEDVRAFPLRVHTQRDSAWPPFLITPLTVTARLARALPVLLTSLPAITRALWSTTSKTAFRERVRLLYATVLAGALVGSLRRERIAPSFIHAHFLGRCTDVARIACFIAGGAWTYSATAHASDVYAATDTVALRGRVRDAAGIVGISHHVLERVAALGAGTPTDLVHCGVPFDALPAQGAVMRVANRVVTVGRLVATKGVHTCLEAAAILHARGVDFEWLFIGDGPLRASLEAQIRRGGLDDKVRLLGSLPEEATLAAMQTAACFVLPCQTSTNGDSDGIPVAIMEAMALSVPVVSTDTGGITELVEDAVTGMIVAPRDASAVASAVAHLLEDEAAGELLASAALQRVKSDFNADVEASKLLDVLGKWHDARRPGR
jgi:glycosyltransferase involved in cell wall biosynthesis